MPPVDHPLIDAADVADLKGRILGTGLTVGELVATAWAAASTYRDTDRRGGANGARIRLAPQKNWPANDPAVLAKVLNTLEVVQGEFNATQSEGKRVSLADLVVLGGCAGIEMAAKNAGNSVQVPFTPGRTDARQEQTDAESFAVLEPTADGFRNYLRSEQPRQAEELLVEKAALLKLTAPQMTALVGGLRVLNANPGRSQVGVLTTRPEALTNDFFVNLLDMGTTWEPASEGVYEGRDRASGTLKWTCSRVDLVFGSNSQLRAYAEVYASADGQQAFVRDFVAAWAKGDGPRPLRREVGLVAYAVLVGPRILLLRPISRFSARIRSVAHGPRSTSPAARRCPPAPAPTTVIAATPVMPSLPAIEMIASYSDAYSARCSCTMRTARSRTPTGYFPAHCIGISFSKIPASTFPGAAQPHTRRVQRCQTVA